MTKQTYKITVDGGTYVDNLTEAEVEALQRKYHGFVGIEKIGKLDTTTFDWDQLAQEISTHV